MKVYMTEGSEIESQETFGIFSTLELAKAELLRRGTKDIGEDSWGHLYWTYIITEWELDGKEGDWWRLEYDKEKGLYWTEGKR